MRIALILAAVIMAVHGMAGIAQNPTDISDEQLFAALDLSRPGLDAVQEAVGEGDYERAAAAWAEYFQNRHTPTIHFRREGVRLKSNNSEYIVLLEGAEAAGISTDAECACVRLEGGEPAEAWAVQGTELTVNGVPWYGQAETDG